MLVGAPFSARRRTHDSLVKSIRDFHRFDFLAEFARQLDALQEPLTTGTRLEVGLEDVKLGCGDEAIDVIQDQVIEDGATHHLACRCGPKDAFREINRRFHWPELATETENRSDIIQQAATRLTFNQVLSRLSAQRQAKCLVQVIAQ
jgi:hypothetical protein